MANQLKMATVHSILRLHEAAGPGGGSLMNSTWIAGRSRGPSSWQDRQASPLRRRFQNRQRADDPGRPIGAFKTSQRADFRPRVA